MHRLVAEAFIPNPNNYPYVNHKDENKQNPKANNLEWCTMEYNFEYGTARERMIKSKSRRVYQYDVKGNLIKIWASTKECKRNGFFGVCNCCNGKAQTCKGYIWSYTKLNKSEIEEKLSKRIREKKIPVKKKSIIRKIYQYDNDMKLIKIWDSLNELRDNGYDKANVSRCCSGKQKAYKGYKWKYEISEQIK